MAKLSVRIPMRWSDLDAYGHVNNAKMLTLLEEARIAAFWGKGARPRDGEDEELYRAAQVLAGDGSAGTHTLIASQRVEYMRQLQWTGEDVVVDLWLSAIGGASVEVCYELIDAAGQVVAKATTAMVSVDSETGRPRSIPEEDRKQLATLLDEPVTFRR